MCYVGSVQSDIIEHTRRHPVSRHILRDVHANEHFNSPSSRHNSAESSGTAKTAKNAEKWRYWSMRHDAFFLAARAADLSSLRAYPLSPSPTSLSSTTSSTRYPPPSGVSLARVQADGSSILRSHCYSKYPAPFGRARARASKRERESESTARCVTMPGHSWHCYRYCYYYRYCCRLRPSGEWESRGPMSQLLRRVLH